MGVTNDVQLPTTKELTVDEVCLSTCSLMTAAPYLGKACENINNEFMLCRTENSDPRPCVELGKRVTHCAMQVFRHIKIQCPHEFNQYSNCLDKSSGDYKLSKCRKTQAVFDQCMEEKLNITRPHWGYFTRARVHDSPSAPPTPPPCPCHPNFPDPTPGLPDCKPRPPARFYSRQYWHLE